MKTEAIVSFKRCESVMHGSGCQERRAPWRLIRKQPTTSRAESKTSEEQIVSVGRAGDARKHTSCPVNQDHQRAQSGLLELVFKQGQNEFFGFLPTLGLMTDLGGWGEQTEQRRKDRGGEGRATEQFYQACYRRNAEYTRETVRGKTQKKKAGNQVAPPVLLENKSFFNCASSELYQNLTLELYKSLDFAEKIYRTGTSEQNTSYERSCWVVFFFFF